MNREHLRLQVGGGDIHVLLSRPIQGDDTSRCVIFSHGFTVPGFESHRMFVDISDRLLYSGWSTVLFDYRGSGYSSGHFSDMTIDTEVEDLTSVLSFARTLLPNAWVALWGMSLGTAIAAEVAAERSDVRALVSWCLSAELYDRFSPRYASDFARQGYSVLPSGYIVKPSLVESMRNIDTYSSLRRIIVPRLFVNGDSDEQTDIRMAKLALSESSGDCELFAVQGGNHGFKGQSDLFNKAVEKSIGWLDAHNS